MSELIEQYKNMEHVTGDSVTGIVTPSKHRTKGNLKRCACGVLTYVDRCGVCRAEIRAGLSLRVKVVV